MENFWKDFGIGEFKEVPAATESVAESVLKAFDVEYTGQGGGPLSHVDIKRLDALTAIRLSLLEELALTGEYKELIINNEGKAEFIRVGEEGRGVTDLYYTIQSQDYVTRKSGVLVTGGKPLPKRYMGETSDILEVCNAVRFYDANYMVSNCMRPYFKSYHIITYDDPHLSSSYKDGIDNLYEILNPFDRIIGYAYYIDPGEVNEDVTISFNKQASVPVLISPDGKIGTLAKIKQVSGEDYNCYGDIEEPNPISGISIDLPAELRFTTIRGVPYDKFIKVANVFVVATELEYCVGVPNSIEAAKSGKSDPTNTDLWVALNNPVKSVFKLEEGIHYAVGYKEGTVFVQFADRSDPRLNPLYGDDVTAFVRSDCTYGKDHTIIKGSILPTDNVRGLWVHQVYAIIDLDTPCITIQDPLGAAADIGDRLKYQITPLMMTQKPAPIAYNGKLIDLTDGYADHDPTTTQSFTDTEMEQVLEDMSGGAGLSLSLSSLDEAGTERLSNELYKLFISDKGISTIYICGPNCNPDVGARGPSGGIINEVTYSYSDSGSYTVSVTEGSFLSNGLPSNTTGIVSKLTEEVPANGTVIEDEGNHVMFKVLLDGVGVRQAINTTSSIIRVGDRVSVSMHNNPVEG